MGSFVRFSQHAETLSLTPGGRLAWVIGGKKTRLLHARRAFVPFVTFRSLFDDGKKY